MTPEEQAKKLAEWLDSAPGEAPPSGLDPEVLEAIYALQPDRAPKAKVEVDGILSRIESGPFARTEQATASENALLDGSGDARGSSGRACRRIAATR